ncbi:MAG: alpha/beta hydrolase [Deltaproteobacteria bacterium]|nr:alpha/beta hydrolase [Deltaproteobacteria bacterium]
MPIAKVRGINMNYKILGDRGPWVALSPGGRRDISGIELLATCVAERGHRVVVFDRRNCGASDVVIDGDDSEYEIWADDIHELLRQLGALPAIVGGSSSGCRTALLFALRHPDAVRALLLWRVTGGRFACERLAQEYYGQYMTAAKEGGMAAVCEMEHWKERIAARPENRAALMKMAPERFIAVMAHWRLHRPGKRQHPWASNRRDPRSPAAKQRGARALSQTLRRGLKPEGRMGRKSWRDGRAVRRFHQAGGRVLGKVVDWLRLMSLSGMVEIPRLQAKQDSAKCEPREHEHHMQ